MADKIDLFRRAGRYKKSPLLMGLNLQVLNFGLVLSLFAKKDGNAIS
jgi:hypothetical protein